MRALITGVGGFTGFYVAQALNKAGYEIFGLASKDVNNQSVIKTFDVNLNDFNGLQKVIEEVQPQIVVHLAAISFVAHGCVDEIYQTNIVGTRNLLEALRQCAKNLKCVLLASSANVYGNISEGFLSEQQTPKPVNDYAVSKLAMEYMAATFQELLPITVVRPFNYTGVGQAENFLVPKIISHFKRRADFIELGNINVARDFSDVRMVAEIYRQLVQTPAAIGQTFNVCSGKAISLLDIISIASEVTGHKIEIKVNPAFVRQNEVKVLAGNRSKLDSLLSEKQIIPIHQTLDWMLNN